MNLVVYPDILLRQQAKAVPLVEGRLKKVFPEMYQLMIEHRGIGLAAPQVGILQRFFIMDLGDGLRIFINPVIVSTQGKESKEEGCLSLPQVAVEVQRDLEVRVRYWDENEKEHLETFKGLPARVIQHEIDHLDGRLIIDYASFNDKLKNAERLKELEKQYFEKIHGARSTV